MCKATQQISWFHSGVVNNTIEVFKLKQNIPPWLLEPGGTWTPCICCYWQVTNHKSGNAVFCLSDKVSVPLQFQKIYNHYGVLVVWSVARFPATSRAALECIWILLRLFLAKNYLNCWIFICLESRRSRITNNKLIFKVFQIKKDGTSSIRQNFAAGPFQIQRMNSQIPFWSFFTIY